MKFLAGAVDTHVFAASGRRLNSCFAGRGGAAWITLALPYVLGAGFSSCGSAAEAAPGATTLSSTAAGTAGMGFCSLDSAALSVLAVKSVGLLSQSSENSVGS